MEKNAFLFVAPPMTFCCSVAFNFLCSGAIMVTKHVNGFEEKFPPILKGLLVWNFCIENFCKCLIQINYEFHLFKNPFGDFRVGIKPD